MATERAVPMMSVTALMLAVALAAVIWRSPCDKTFTDDAYVRGADSNQLWIEAFFTKIQLAHLRIGQPASLVLDIHGERITYEWSLVLDIHGERITYEGTVVGYAVGTGGRFAPLPVRIELDPQLLPARPLRPGLPMRVNVDTSDRTGAALDQSYR